MPLPTCNLNPDGCAACLDPPPFPDDQTLHHRPSRHGRLRARPRGRQSAAAIRSSPPPASELDLCDQAAVFAFLATQQPDIVIIAAAKVGGIHRQLNLSGGFHLSKTSPSRPIWSKAAAAPACRACCSSARPASIRRMAPQPMPEDCLLTSPLEPSNEAYAIAKIAGLKLCQHYRAQHGLFYHSAMPTNLYGPGDNYHPRELPRHPRAHPPLPRGDGSAAMRPSPSGAPAPRAASSSMSRISPAPASTC